MINEYWKEINNMYYFFGCTDTEEYREKFTILDYTP
jgi:hypothetical protein